MKSSLYTSHSRKCGYVIVLMLFAALSFQAAQAAAGLLLYTANGASYVNAVQYETFTSPSSHLSYVTVKGGQRMQVKSDGIIANIPYPSSGAQVDQEEASGWIVQTDMFAGRYPQYATLLKGIGELWKRKLETIKVAQVSAPVTSTGSSAQPKSTDVPSPLSEIAVLQTKSGQTFKKVTITRFDGDKAIINYADGIGRVSLSDFGDLSALPQDVKLAIEKATAVVNESKNKAEAERIAGEERERLANEKREQERLASTAASSEKTSSSSNADKRFTGLNEDAKSMVKLWCQEDPGMIAWIERQFAGVAISNDEASDMVKGSVSLVTMIAKTGETSAPLKEDILDSIKEFKDNLQQGNQQQEKSQDNANNQLKNEQLTDEDIFIGLHNSAFSIEPRGPKVHNFQLGMLYDDFFKTVQSAYPSKMQIGFYLTMDRYLDIGSLIGKPNNRFHPMGFVANSEDGRIGAGLYSRPGSNKEDKLGIASATFIGAGPTKSILTSVRF